MIRVVQIFRKRNPLFFSIEKVFATVWPYLREKVQVTSIELPHYNTGLLSIFRNLFYLTTKKSTAVYHITGDVHYVLLALPTSRTVLTIHDCVFLHTTAGFKRRILKWLFLDMPVKRAAIITTISEFSRQEILRFTNCATDKVMVIPNPLNETIRFEERVFNDIKPGVLFIGTTANKNLERVAAALNGISCQLRIVGRLTPLQEQILLTNGIDFFVKYNITENELADMYVQSDMVLFPSTFEGFGLPILEGQKAGRIVITSNIDPMKTVAGGGAFLVDPADTADIRNGILKMIDDTDMRNSLIRNGFKNILKYNAVTIADAYCGVYEKLAKNTA